MFYKEYASHRLCLSVVGLGIFCFEKLFLIAGMSSQNNVRYTFVGSGYQWKIGHEDGNNNHLSLMQGLKAFMLFVCVCVCVCAFRIYHIKAVRRSFRMLVNSTGSGLEPNIQWEMCSDQIKWISSIKSSEIKLIGCYFSGCVGNYGLEKNQEIIFWLEKIRKRFVLAWQNSYLGRWGLRKLHNVYRDSVRQMVRFLWFVKS